MLQRVHHDRGLVTLQSPRLAAIGVVHGFSTRVGGVSPPPFDSLNLGSLAKSVEPGDDSDPNANVAENFRRFRAAIGAAKRVRVAVRQVHGSGVWSPPSGAVKPGDEPEADAIVTGDPLQMAVVRTADCAPVLLATPDGKRVAAAHAGWRGLVAGVLGRAVETLAERSGAEPRELVAAVGPAIGVEAYEVGPEVAKAFHDAELMPVVRLDFGDKPHVDLRAAVVLRLAAAGLDPDRIDTTDHCTHRDADWFYSYRRDGRRSGRLAAAIAPRP